MKILGLIVAVLGWLIAISSTQLSGAPVQTVVALAGFVVSLIGVLGILNAAHLKNAIWKS
jgi:hypothetical protein